MAPYFSKNKAKIFPSRPCFEALNTSSMYRTWPFHLEIRGVDPVRPDKRGTESGVKSWLIWVSVGIFYNLQQEVLLAFYRCETAVLFAMRRRVYWSTIEKVL